MNSVGQVNEMKIKKKAQKHNIDLVNKHYQFKSKTT